MKTYTLKHPISNSVRAIQITQETLKEIPKSFTVKAIEDNGVYVAGLSYILLETFIPWGYYIVIDDLSKVVTMSKNQFDSTYEEV